MGSPYNTKESLRWLLHLASPSWTEPTTVDRQPLSARLAGSIPGQQTVRIALFGDLMPLPNRWPLAVTPSLRRVFQEADLVIGNLETPVAAQTSLKPFMFAMGADRVRATLEELGVRQTREHCILNVANNHAGDQRATGFEETVNQLEALGVSIAGVQRRGRPVVPTIQVESVRVAVLAWTDWINRDRFPGGFSVCRREQIGRQIAAARDAGADSLLGYPHWDFEFCLFPSARTVRLARKVLSQGVTALIGHHPHVLQPVVRYPEGLCAHSLGNATPLPTRLVRWPTMIGACMCLDVVSEGDHLGDIAAYRVIPIRIRRERERIRLSAISIDAPASEAENILLSRLFPARPPNESGLDAPAA